MVVPATFSLDLGRPASELRTMGTAGLTASDKHPGSYLFLTAADPATRRGVVAGSLTVDHGSGVLFSGVKDGRVEFKAQIDYGHLRIPAGESARLETVVRAQCDSGNAIAEASETNNEQTATFPLPDLVVGDVWWSPINPVDGQGVTFYARVDNVGAGGMATDFDVKFVVDAGSTNQNVLGTARISDDALLGQRQVVFANADFEQGNLTNNWTSGGSVAAVPRYDSGNRWCARLNNGGSITSAVFVVSGEYLEFSAYQDTYYGGNGRLRLWEAGTNRRPGAGGEWHSSGGSDFT